MKFAPVVIRTLLSPATKTTDFATSNVAVDDLDGEVALVLQTTYSSGSIAAYAQTSVGPSTTSFASVGTFTTVDYSSGTTQVVNLDVRDCGKYVRIYGDCQGNTVSHVVGASLIGQKK